MSKNASSFLKTSDHTKRSVQDKFKWPICCCQIISRECCNYSLIHFLVFRNSNLSVIDRNLNFLNLPVHFCKKAQLRIYFSYSSAIQWCCWGNYPMCSKLKICNWWCCHLHNSDQQLNYLWSRNCIQSLRKVLFSIP